MLDAPVPGKRHAGREKTKSKYLCKGDMESWGLKEEGAPGRTKWKNDMQYHSRCWEKSDEKKKKN